MEDNKPQGEEQSKEEKKIDARFERAMRQLTAVMGPDWFKSQKISKDQIPDLIKEIVDEKKAELFTRFKTNYKALVERKKHLDKTITDKTKELQKVILEAKKEFLKEVDAAFVIVAQIEQIEKDYYNTLGNEDELEATEPNP